METKELDNEYVAHSYGRFNTALSKGNGSTVYDESGKEYIDFGSGIGVTAFGLCDNEWKAAVEMQLDKIQQYLLRFQPKQLIFYQRHHSLLFR